MECTIEREGSQIPFNGSGVFSRVYNWVSDKNNSIDITASRVDAEDNGFATGLSTCLLKDGTQIVTANIPFNGFQLNSVGAGTALTDAANISQIQGGAAQYLASVAGTNTITANTSPVITSYAAGQRFSFIPAVTNTGATTINLNSLGAKNIYKKSAAGAVAVVANNLIAGQVYTIQYDGTQFELLDPIALLPENNLSDVASVSTAASNLGVPTLTGTNAFAGTNTFATQAQGDYSTKPATTQFFTQNLTGGFINKFRNAGFRVLQRGTSGTVSSGTTAYTADGWRVKAAGAAATFSFVGVPSGYGLALAVTGNTSMTDTAISQRIEGNVAEQMGYGVGTTVTVQALIFQNTGANITPTLTVNYANALNNFSTVTNILNAAALDTCANNGWTLVAYTFVIPNNTPNYQGLEVIFDFGSALNTNAKSVYLGRPDFRSTPGASIGNITTTGDIPPPPEIRPISIEMPMNQRYFASTFGNGNAPAQNFGKAGCLQCMGGNTQPQGIQWEFPVTMLSVPNITTYNPSASNANLRDFTGATDATVTVDPNTAIGSTGVYISSAAINGGHFGGIHATASAEL